jgi:hypothetical protein
MSSPLSLRATPSYRYALIVLLLLGQGLVPASAARLTPRRPSTGSSAVVLEPAAPLAAMPALAGEDAVEHLKTTGGYGSLAEAMAASRLKVRADAESQFWAVNAAHQLRACFAANRVELTSTRPEASKRWRLGLATVGVGFGDEAVGLVAEGTRAERARMSYEWRTRTGARVTEWYENRTEGLEQGYTVWSAPGGEGTRLTIAMRLDGELRAKVGAGGQRARFVDRRGRVRLRYEKLAVWDATGRALDARMAGGGRELRVEVEACEAVYPVTIDPIFVEAAALSGSTTSAGDQFGNSVAISGSTAIVGVPLDDSSGTNDFAGAAFVFERNADGADAWDEVARLTGSTTTANDQFGFSVAIDGSTAIVGARLDDSPGTDDDAGAAFVFERNAGGADAWDEVARLTSSANTGGDLFGWSVAISGSTVVVGAPGDDSLGTIDAEGAAFVFERNAGGADAWGEIARLTGSTATAFASFGNSVAISGTTAVIGAPFDDNPSANDTAGAAYIYERNAGGAGAWDEVARLTGSTTTTDDLFGYSVAISGSTAVVSAPTDDSPDTNDGAGAAFVFERNTGGANVWGEVARLTGSTTTAFDNFGWSVAISGSTAIVGANADDSPGVNDGAGAAFVFERNRGGVDSWNEVARLTGSTTSAGDFFGLSVAISGSSAIVGANFDDSPGTDDDAGRAFVFEDVCNEWREVARSIGSTTSATDFIGFSVAIDGSTAVVGAVRDDSPGTSDDAGAAFVFERNAGGADSWDEVARLTGSTTTAGDEFGISVAIDGSTAVVGADADDSPGTDDFSGAAFVFERNAGGPDAWGEVARLTGSTTTAGDEFGWSVAISGSTAVVGANLDDSSGTNNGAGAAFVFERSMGGPDAWGEVARLVGSTSSVGDQFGWSVTISGSTVVVGAYRDDSTDLNDQSGAAFVFERNAGGADAWGEVARLTGSTSSAGDWFGYSVAISGSTAIVGAAFDDSPGTSDGAGAAFVFERNGGRAGADSWDEVARLTGSTTTAGDFFGWSVAISGSTAVVGTSFDDSAGANDDAGAAFVFERNGGGGAGVGAWDEVVRLTGSTSSEGDQFGYSVAIDGSTIVVGAPFDDNSGTSDGAGAAFVFTRDCACVVTCPADVTVANDPDQCGAVVNYPAPTTTGACGTIVCAPAPGSFFPVGTTTVTCSDGGDTRGGVPTSGCSFTVTVNDTQPPAIACPANITTTANALNAPGGCTIGRVVTYPNPTVGDNCPAAPTVSCVPASGSFFPTGTTTVTCTARDMAGNTNSCAFTITVNSPTSVCFRDDASGDTFFEVVDSTNPLFGFWRYRTAAGVVYCAKAEYTSYVPGRSLISWNRTNAAYFMDCNANLGNRTATVTVTVRATNTRFTLRDRNTSDNPACVLN